MSWVEFILGIRIAEIIFRRTFDIFPESHAKYFLLNFPLDLKHRKKEQQMVASKGYEGISSQSMERERGEILEK